MFGKHILLVEPFIDNSVSRSLTLTFIHCYLMMSSPSAFISQDVEPKHFCSSCKPRMSNHRHGKHCVNCKVFEWPVDVMHCCEMWSDELH